MVPTSLFKKFIKLEFNQNYLEYLDFLLLLIKTFESILFLLNLV